LTNALKHSAARNIWVRVVFGPETVELSVEDDGQGFDPADHPGPREGHFGLQGMRERMKRLRGMLEIARRPGGGMRIAATVPITA
jgi:signal transduction histidine kinase